MRIFVIWDLVAPAVRTLVEALPELLPKMPAKADAKEGATEGERSETITWLIPGVTVAGKEMARDVIAANMRSAEHVIALLDRPSMSVGWQIGLALGWGRSLQLASIGDALPSWTQVGALKGLFTHHLNDVTGMAQLVEPLTWQLPAIPIFDPLPQDTEPPPSSLVLCPGGPIGSTLREVALRDRSLRALPDEGWGLYELPRLLSGYARVVWVMASDGKGQAQELADNASNGVIAGFAEGSELEVSVLRADDIPPVVDVQPREHRFRGLSEFKQKLQIICVGASITASRPALSSVSSSAWPAALPPEHTPSQRRWALLAVLILMCVGAFFMARFMRGRAVWPAVPGTPQNTSQTPAEVKRASPPPTAVMPDLGTVAPTEKVPHAAAVKNEKRVSRSRRGELGADDAYALMNGMMQLATNSMAMDPNLQPPATVEGPSTAPKKAPPKRTSSGCEISDDELKQLIRDTKNEALQQQWAVLSDGTEGRCLSMKQLRTLLNDFYLNNDRVRILRWVGPRVLDPQKAYQLEDMLVYREEIALCKQLFGCCKAACVSASP